ncbi:MAG TPA: DMT family transporter [Caldisericia bacterium]|nr:DMT family transporter [Caldisericia bacterium]
MSTPKKPKSQGIALWIALSILSWSSVASACKWTLEYIDSSWTLFFSSLTSAVVLFILLLFHPSCSVNQKLKWKYLLMGFLNPFLYYFILFEAYRMSPAQEALVLNYTWAILLALLSAIYFRKALKWKSLLGMLISFLGVYVVVSKGSIFLPQWSLGNGLALVSAVVWAVYWVLNMKEEGSPLPALFVQFSSASLLVLLFNLAVFPIPRTFSLWGIAGSIYLGIFEMSLPFFWWLLALKRSEQTSQTIHWVYLSPILSMVWIAILLKEEIRLYSILGLILVLMGILLGKGINPNLDKRNREIPAG